MNKTRHYEIKGLNIRKEVTLYGDETPDWNAPKDPTQTTDVIELYVKSCYYYKVSIFLYEGDCYSGWCGAQYIASHIEELSNEEFNRIKLQYIPVEDLMIVTENESWYREIDESWLKIDNDNDDYYSNSSIMLELGYFKLTGRVPEYNREEATRNVYHIYGDNKSIDNYIETLRLSNVDNLIDLREADICEEYEILDPCLYEVNDDDNNDSEEDKKYLYQNYIISNGENIEKYLPGNCNVINIKLSSPSRVHHTDPDHVSNVTIKNTQIGDLISRDFKSKKEDIKNKKIDDLKRSTFKTYKSNVWEDSMYRINRNYDSSGIVNKIGVTENGPVIYGTHEDMKKVQELTLLGSGLKVPVVGTVEPNMSVESYKIYTDDGEPMSDEFVKNLLESETKRRELQTINEMRDLLNCDSIDDNAKYNILKSQGVQLVDIIAYNKFVELFDEQYGLEESK